MAEWSNHRHRLQLVPLPEHLNSSNVYYFQCRYCVADFVIPKKRLTRMLIKKEN